MNKLLVAIFTMASLFAFTNTDAQIRKIPAEVHPQPTLR